VNEELIKGALNLQDEFDDFYAETKEK